MVSASMAAWPTASGRPPSRDATSLLRPAAVDCRFRDDHVRRDRASSRELAGNRVRLEWRGVLLRDQGPAVVRHRRRRQLLAPGECRQGHRHGLRARGRFPADGQPRVHARLTATSTPSSRTTRLWLQPCGSGLCTVTDPLDANGNAIIDGNPFPQAPKYVAYVTARYGIPIGNGELFFYTDWAFQGETNFFLYESKEFKSDNTYEGGARIGYSFNQGQVRAGRLWTQHHGRGKREGRDRLQQPHRLRQRAARGWHLLQRSLLICTALLPGSSRERERPGRRERFTIIPSLGIGRGQTLRLISSRHEAVRGGEVVAAGRTPPRELELAREHPIFMTEIDVEEPGIVGIDRDSRRPPA